MTVEPSSSSEKNDNGKNDTGKKGESADGKPIESVWDYPRPPRLEPVDHLVEIIHHGITVARSTGCIRVLETSQPPAYYIPSDDLDLSLLRPSATVTFCEWKGVAAYADLGFDDLDPASDDPIHPVPDGAWTYPTPSKGFQALAGFWAFYAQKLEHCLVDGERVDPNEGGFYGGWITANITGPFKGGPGTAHW